MNARYRRDADSEAMPVTASSGPVDAAVATYVERAGRFASPNMVRRVGHIANLLIDFAPERFSQQALDAASLQGIANHVIYPNSNVRTPAAIEAIRTYFRHPENNNDRQQNGFISTVFGDYQYIDAAADDFETRVVEAGHGAVFDRTRLLTSDDWLNLQIGPNIPKLAEITKKTNIESVIARCAMQIDHVTSPVEDDDLKLFRDVQRIESFDTAMLDALGLNALSILASSNAGKVRAVKSGNEETLEAVYKMHEKIKRVSTEQIMNVMFGKKPKEHLFQVYDNSKYDEQIIFSSTDVSEFFDAKSGGKINSRFKGVGDHTMKILRNPNYDSCNGEKRPMDVFGMLAIMPDEDSLADFFNYVVDTVSANNAFSFKPSASKDPSKQFFIQGSERYIKSVTSRLHPEIQRSLQPEKKGANESRNYQVLKFTCEVKFGEIVIPVEFQFQTKIDRENARFGYVSHLNHHARNAIPGIPSKNEKSLRGVRSRISRMDANGHIVNGQSASHGYEFERRFRELAGMPPRQTPVDEA